MNGGETQMECNRRIVFSITGFGFRVSGFGFHVSGFGFHVSCFVFRVSCFVRGDTKGSYVLS